MRVKWRGRVSSLRNLVGGSGQGTGCGGVQYIVGSSDVARDVDSDMKYRYFDDLEILELVMVSGLLVDYNFWNHVASDIGIDQNYLESSEYKMQSVLDNISDWSVHNKVLLNESKSNFIIFSRCQTKFVSRLIVNNKNLEQVRAIRLPGLLICEDLSWQLNCKLFCI